jgi:hypothetical protein
MTFKNKFLALTALFFFKITVSFSQWVPIEKNKSKPITIQCSDRTIELKKYSDTISFTNWLNEMIVICPEVAFQNQKDLEDAYDRTTNGESLYTRALPQASIDNLDWNVLIRDIENPITFTANWNPNHTAYRLEATDATIQKISKSNLITYTINPKGIECRIKIIAKDSQGNEEEIENKVFRVISLPIPELANITISKKSGSTIEIKPVSLFPKINYTIESIQIPELNTTLENDSFISPSLLKKLKKNSLLSLIIIAHDFENNHKVKFVSNLLITD